MPDCPLPLEGGLFRSRPAPPGAILRTTYQSADARFRYSHSRIWGATRPKLVWVTYHPHATDTDTRSLLINRLTRWTYRAGYDGFVVVSLYPKVALSLAAVRAWRDEEAIVVFAPVNEAARAAARVVRDLRCQDVVLATGALQGDEIADLEAWLALFQEQTHHRIKRWWCLGTNEKGWPVAPARAGARAVKALDPLIAWQFPVPACTPLPRPA